MLIGSYEIALKAIEQYDSIVIFHHIRPDGDCLGSQAGLAEMIRINYPKKKVFVVGNNYGVLNFMNYEFDDIAFVDWNNSLGVVVDAGSGDRIENSEPLYENKTTKNLRIDHHPNTADIKYDYNWVDSSYAAAAEMVGYLAMLSKWKINNKVASHTYLGINTDSGRFLYPSTSSRTYDVVSFLMTEGSFHPSKILGKISKRNVIDLKYSGYILNNFKKEGRVLYLVITQATMKNLNISTARAAMSVNELANIEDNNIWIFIIEDEEKMVRVRLRSNGPLVNIVAREYGGGGHNNASGCHISSMEEIPTLLKQLNKQITIWEKENKS